MSAIEVLKREKKYMKLHCGSISNGQWIPRDLRLAFDEAVLALEQKEKLVEWLEKEIVAGRIKQSRAQTQGENVRQTISMTRLKALREVLGELK